MYILYEFADQKKNCIVGKIKLWKYIDCSSVKTYYFIGAENAPVFRSVFGLQFLITNVNASSLWLSIMCSLASTGQY